MSARRPCSATCGSSRVRATRHTTQLRHLRALSGPQRLGMRVAVLGDDETPAPLAIGSMIERVRERWWRVLRELSGVLSQALDGRGADHCPRSSRKCIPPRPMCRVGAHPLVDLVRRLASEEAPRRCHGRRIPWPRRRPWPLAVEQPRRVARVRGVRWQAALRGGLRRRFRAAASGPRSGHPARGSFGGGCWRCERPGRVPPRHPRGERAALRCRGAPLLLEALLLADTLKPRGDRRRSEGDQPCDRDGGDGG
jgi:hypothetical protein